MNEHEQHEKLKNKIKIAGFIALCTGLVLSAVAFVDFFLAIRSGDMPGLFFLFFIGFPLLGIGGGLLSFGYRREILRYGKNESMPVIKEAGREAAPVIKDMADAWRDGQNAGTERKIICACGGENDADSRYCKKCGRPLSDVCPHCGKPIDRDSVYCRHCGGKIHD